MSFKPGGAPDLRPYRSPHHQPFSIGSGPAGVLLIHGFPGTPAEMRPIGELLAGCGWKAHGLLLPGFGPDIASLEQRWRSDWLQAASQAYDQLFAEQQPVALVGYSMGAALAMHLAAHRSPQRLVLLAPFWRLPGWLPKLAPLARRFLPRLRPLRKADFNDARLQEMFNRILPDVDLSDARVQETIREQFTLPVAAVDEMLRLGRSAYHQANLITSPTLIIQGAQDKLVQPRLTAQLRKKIDNRLVTYIELPGDHELLAESSAQRDEIARLVVNFLRMGCL